MNNLLPSIKKRAEEAFKRVDATPSNEHFSYLDEKQSIACIERAILDSVKEALEEVVETINNRKRNFSNVSCSSGIDDELNREWNDDLDSVIRDVNVLKGKLSG